MFSLQNLWQVSSGAFSRTLLLIYSINDSWLASIRNNTCLALATLLFRSFKQCFIFLFLQFKVSGISAAEVEQRRALREMYPDNALEHPKRVAEVPTSFVLKNKRAWNSSTQVLKCDLRSPVNGRIHAFNVFQFRCAIQTQAEQNVLPLRDVSYLHREFDSCGSSRPFLGLCAALTSRI